MPPGVVHEKCQGADEPLPHKAASAAWQRKGTVAALAAELEQIKGGPS